MAAQYLTEEKSSHVLLVLILSIILFFNFYGKNIFSMDEMSLMKPLKNQIRFPQFSSQIKSGWVSKQSLLSADCQLCFLEVATWPKR